MYIYQNGYSLTINVYIVITDNIQNTCYWSFKEARFMYL